MDESKRERFVRLAENRVNATLKQIELLGNLSNKSAYDYSQDDVNLIIKTLKEALSDLEVSFKSDKKSKNKFMLRR